jgi:hypothetical protein
VPRGTSQAVSAANSAIAAVLVPPDDDAKWIPIVIADLNHDGALDVVWSAADGGVIRIRIVFGQ